MSARAVAADGTRNFLDYIAQGENGYIGEQQKPVPRILPLHACNPSGKIQHAMSLSVKSSVCFLTVCAFRMCHCCSVPD